MFFRNKIESPKSGLNFNNITSWHAQQVINSKSSIRAMSLGMPCMERVPSGFSQA
jgi:hypothetical protein